MAPVGTLYIMQLDAFLHRKIMQDLRIQRVKVLMMLYTSNYFVKVRQKQLLDHTYSLSRDQAFDYMTEFNKRLSDKVGIKCTMDILLPTDDDNANIIIEHNGIIKKLPAGRRNRFSLYSGRGRITSIRLSCGTLPTSRLDSPGDRGTS